MEKNMRTLLMLLAVVICVVVASAQAETPLIGDKLDVISTENIASLEIITLDIQGAKQIAVSPDGSKIAIASQYLDNNYNIYVYDNQSRDEINTIQGRMDSFREMLWSPDSSRIAVISGRRTGGGVEERSVKTYKIDYSFSPGNYIMGNSDVWYTDYVYPEDQPENEVTIAWSNTSDMLSVSFHNRLVIYAVTEETVLFSSEVIGIERVEWSTNGHMIFTQNVNGQTQVWGIPLDVGSAN